MTARRPISFRDRTCLQRTTVAITRISLAVSSVYISCSRGIIEGGAVLLLIRDFLRLSAHIQMLPVLESGEETLVGGQAVMEGVMMRAPHSYCVAVRRANGEIVTDQSPLPRVSEKYPIFKLPILRGLGTLGQAMGLGFKALRFSANAALDDRTPADPAKPANAKRKEMPGWLMWANLLFSLGFFIFLYKFVPLTLATELGRRFPAIGSTLAINLIDGVI